MSKNFLITTIVAFAVLAGVFLYMKTALPAFDFAAMMVGNILMAVLSSVSYLMVTKQIKSRPEAFVRGVYSGTFLKLLVCMAAILIYVMAKKPDIHKPTLFVLFGIYIVYTVIETTTLSKMARVK